MIDTIENALFWHRRDLRFEDNAGLFKAQKAAKNVYPIFIFDTTILDHLPTHDQRVLFIYEAILNLKVAYRNHGSDLLVRYGDPRKIIPEIAAQFEATAVFVNRDYEPKAMERDQTIFQLLQTANIAFKGAKDQVIFEKEEIIKVDKTPYTVFTPYSKKWKLHLNDFFLKAYPNEAYVNRLKKFADTLEMPSLESMGFKTEKHVQFPMNNVNKKLISGYKETRDIPSILGTTRLSVHLRFGTLSIRHIARIAHSTNETFLNELIWRDFYQMILYYFPQSVNHAIRPKYDTIPWEFNETHFQAWCKGTTGYPLVDAGMRELNETGFMHNRVRMVVASFLTKHLLHDWRLGERYFAEKLLDFDLASNIGGWQWASGSGCDAAPYFRIFNPTSQQERFDPQFEYIKKWVPEFGTKNYPQPIIDHNAARNRALEVYKKALNAE